MLLILLLLLLLPPPPPPPHAAGTFRGTGPPNCTLAHTATHARNLPARREAGPPRGAGCAALPEPAGGDLAGVWVSGWVAAWVGGIRSVPRRRRYRTVYMFRNVRSTWRRSPAPPPNGNPSPASAAQERYICFETAAPAAGAAGALLLLVRLPRGGLRATLSPAGRRRRLCTRWCQNGPGPDGPGLCGEIEVVGGAEADGGNGGRTASTSPPKLCGRRGATAPLRRLIKNKKS